jgi:predicted dehydrogenase
MSTGVGKQTIAGPQSPPAGPPRARLGFLGLGWIGRNRLQCVLQDDIAEVSAIADVSHASLEAAAALAPGAARGNTLQDLLATSLDGVVIATPSAQHATESAAVLDAGIAVFCQKPLARTAAEAFSVVERARSANRLLGVDLSYRHLSATGAVTRLLRDGALGGLYALDLTFHNAYGPDKPWYYDRRLAGGGCVMDLGIHLLDLLRGWTGGRAWHVTAASLLTKGRPWSAASETVEDFAHVQLQSDDGMTARVACSWGLPAGCDAVIDFTLHGTEAAARIRNVGGSFYDFMAERLTRGGREVLVTPPDAWAGRAVAAWIAGLARGGEFDDDAHGLVELAVTMDEIYDAASRPRPAAGGKGLAST